MNDKHKKKEKYKGNQSVKILKLFGKYMIKDRN